MNSERGCGVIGSMVVRPVEVRSLSAPPRKKDEGRKEKGQRLEAEVRAIGPGVTGAEVVKTVDGGQPPMFFSVP
jgi:hypothetical protein